MANLSTLVDHFNGPITNVNAWQATGPITYAGGAVRFGDPATVDPNGSGAAPGTLTSVNAYVLDSLTVQLGVVPTVKTAVHFVLSAPDFSYGAAINIDRDTGDPYATISYSYHHSTGNASGAQGFQPASMGWLRIDQIWYDGDHWLEFKTSADGLAWSNLWMWRNLGPDGFGPVKLQIVGIDVSLASVNVLAVPEPGPGTPTPTVVDPFVPAAMAPSVPPPPGPAEENPPECITLLDAIRTFSATVKRAIRIVGPTSIELVDPNAPLPSGWSVDDVDELYSATGHSLTAGETVLSLAAGDLQLAVSASVVTDDVRLITSGWRIPDRLPVYGLDPAPVKRFTATFTPRSFTASVEFHVPTVPLALRRT